MTKPRTPAKPRTRVTKPATTKPRDRHKRGPTPVRFPVELEDELRERAAATGLSVNALVVEAVRVALLRGDDEPR